MAATKLKHQPMLDYIYKCMDRLDITGLNTEVYKNYFGSMSEEEFKIAIKDYLEDPEDELTMEMDSFEQNVTIEDIALAAKEAGVLLEDNLVLPYLSDDQGDPYVTNHKILIGVQNQRRVQQVLPIKNHMSISVDKRNPKTNQVIDEDKNARISDMELYQLIFQQANESLAEFFGPRADDLEAQNEMIYQIQRKGSVSLDEIPNNVANKASLNYMNFLMLAAGYETDLVTKDGLLPIVIDRGGKLYPDE